MSAFIVSDDTISVLARAFVDYQVPFHDGTYNEPRMIIFKDEELKRIGQSLVNQNYRSVNFRYQEEQEPSEFVPTEVEFDEGTVYGCIACYEYQACETADYYESEIHNSLVRLQKSLLERLLRKCEMKAPYGYHGFDMMEE